MEGFNEVFKKFKAEFMNNLYEGKFEIYETLTHTAKCIMGEFEFELWVANGEFSLDIYTSPFINHVVFNKEQKRLVWKQVKKKYESIEKKLREAEIKELKEKLKTLTECQKN